MGTLTFAAAAAVEIQLAETLNRMKMADECQWIAVAAAFPRNYQTGWVVVVRPFVGVQQIQWVVTRFEVVGNFVHLPSERKDSIPVVRSPC